LVPQQLFQKGFSTSGNSSETAKQFTAEAVIPKKRATSDPDYPILFIAIRQNILLDLGTSHIINPDL